MDKKDIDGKVQKTYSSFSNLYYSIFNKKSSKVGYIFYFNLVLSLVENILINLSDIFMLKASISLIFFVPMVILLFENDQLFKICSLFEIKIIIFLKIMILFKKNLNFFEIFIFAFIYNLFHVKFVKSLYINDRFLGNEIKNRTLYKMKIFSGSFSFLLVGLAVNNLLLLYLAFKHKLSFYLFDDIIYHPTTFYFSIFIYLSSRKLFTYLYNISRSQFYFDTIKHSKLILVLLILTHLSITFFILENRNISSLVISSFIALFFIFTYENFGTLTFVFLLIIYFIKKMFLAYIEGKFDLVGQRNILNNTFFMTLSTLLSIMFIFALFYIEKDNLASTYNLLYQRLFIIKSIFDIWLIVNFIYQLFKQNGQNYFDKFYDIYHVIFLIFVANYVIVFICVFLKLNVYVKESDIDFYFGGMVKYVAKEKENINAALYGSSTPYFEIKFYKIVKNFFKHFNIDNNKNPHYKALKNICNFVILEIFFLFCFIANNSLIFYLIYFIMLQFTQSSFNFIRTIIKLIYNLFTPQNSNILYENNAKKLIKKSKYKLIQIFLFPYLIVIWKVFLVKVFLLIYEYFFAKIQFMTFGKLEPVTNVIYQFLRISDQSTTFTLWDIVILILFILPNTYCVLYCHICECEPSFFYKNYAIFNLVGIFFKFHILILIIGVLNIFIILNIFAADEETYESFFIWFDLWGVEPVLA